LDALTLCDINQVGMYVCMYVRHAVNQTGSQQVPYVSFITTVENIFERDAVYCLSA